LLKALKDEARKTVKSLQIQPRNVSAVVEQLRLRYGRPEQLVRSQLSGIREFYHEFYELYINVYCFSPSFWNLVIQNIRQIFEIPIFF